jgi:hypothetical protein
MLGLMESSTASRTPITDKIRKITPEMNTIPSAARHGSGTPAAASVMMTDTKKKFSPIPGASAMGYFAHSPMTIVAAPDTTHVARSTAPKSKPVG